jgi:hypothetical protein
MLSASENESCVEIPDPPGIPFAVRLLQGGKDKGNHRGKQGTVKDQGKYPLKLKLQDDGRIQNAPLACAASDEKEKNQSEKKKDR